MTSLHVGRVWHDDPRQLLLRPFEQSESDLAALAAVRNETMRALTRPLDYHDLKPRQIDVFYNRRDFTLEGNAWLLFLADEPVGAAVVYPSAIFHDRPHGNFDMYIVPRLWRHGLGSRLLAHLEQAAMARGYPVLETTVAGEDRQSTGFLSRHGFRVVGQSAHLVREGLQDLPEIELPEGYLITSASALDAGDPAEFYRETANRLGSYDSNYSLIRPEDLASEANAGHWDPKGVFVLLDEEGRAVGIIRATKLRGSRGLLNEIRLEPSSRGKGLGMAMTATGLRYLASAGASRAELDTTGESTPAHNMAMKAGFVVARHWLHYLKRLHVWPAV